MSSESLSASETVPEKKKEVRSDKRPRQQPRYNVILWNDDAHTFDYVIEMMESLFGYPPEKGFQIAEQVHLQGRAVVLVTTLEHAELKRDQIHAFGRDRQVDDCTGSMWSTIEPVE